MEFFAVDPTETHELDLTAAVLAMRARGARAALQATKPEQLEAAQVAFAEAERAVQSYQRGSGPIFRIGLIAGAKRHELAGVLARYRQAADPDEQKRLDYRWMREVVRFAVRGHANLKRRDGVESPFAGESVVVDGLTYTCPTLVQIEAYYHAGILPLLSMHAWEPQSLSDDEKNV